MESNKKSSPTKKPKPTQKSPVSNKKKNTNIPNPKASQSSSINVSNSTKSSESNQTAKASQSSNKNDSNSKQSTEKPTSRQHSEHNDRRYQRPEKPYHRHSNQRDQRRDNRSHYNSNYDSDRNFNRRPYQNWNSSSNPNNFNNRVWQRNNYNSNHSYNRYGNSNYQNFNNFQRDGNGGNNNYPNHQSRQHPDSFRNFQSPNVESVQNNIGNLFDNSENQNFCEDNSAGEISAPEKNPPETEPTTIQNQEVAFNQLDESLPNQVDENQQLNNDTFPLEQLTEQNQEQVSFTIEEINEDFQPIQQIHENIQEELSTNQNIPSEQFEQLNQYNSPNQSTNDLLANIKTELPEPEFNLDNCLNSNNPSPLISVIPISRLIKSEIQDLNRNDIIAPTTPTGSRRSLRPNLVQRKKSISKDGSLSENLVQRVANMDKVGIKNVINSSGTKYDAALKIQARKKLREEIRKQLKSMNFTPPEDNENNVLIPDEIVDSMSIPAVVLDEIRKAFGIVLVEDKNSKMPAEIAEKVEDSPPPKPAVEPLIQPTETTERPTKSPSPKITPEPIIHSSERSPKSPDLMSRIKMLEECKSQSEKSPPKIKVEPPRRSRSTEPILIIDSSSSSSSSSESSSDSDTSSTSSGSNCSNSSSFKRRRRKKRILEANVVGNFEKLILPNLTPAQRRRYKEKYSKTTKNSLLYIYGVCVSRANSNKNPADEKEQLKLKQNLSSADNAQALEFLMKAILNLFEKQKETLKKNKVNKTLATQSQIKSPNLVSDMRKKSNQRYSDDDKESRRRRSESANSVELSKHQSTDKLDKKQESPKSANASKRVSFSDDGTPVVLEIESDSETTGGENPPSRQWKSPGEKKCIEIEPNMQLSSLGTLKSPLELETALSTLGMMQSPLANYAFDIDSLKSQSKIGDEAVSSIREIDVKLMELHKRKMYIEEMILKLQKDKMEVDLWTMKLQNEKFILLNSALTCASSSSGSPKAVSVTKRNLTEVLVEDDVQARKKRCQRDIQEIPAEATSAIKEIISKMILKPRQTKQQTRRTISSSKDEESSEEKPRPTKPTKQTRKTTNVSKDEESSEETLTPSKRRSSRISKAQDKSDKISSKKQSKPQLEVQPTKVAEKEQKQKEKEKEVIEEEDEDVKTVEVPKIDYSNVANGNLEGWKLPITQIIVIGEAIVAASEDGNIYKFNIRTRVLESKFSKHTEAITQIFTCPKENFVYTTSLDGFLKKTSIENFGLELQSLNLQEPLQSIDIEWNTAFIGSRWGNIFTYDIKNNSLSESLLCSSGSSIIAIRATKEGPRKILIVSSKGNQINFRDAMTGLLLRSLDVPDNLHIYSILLDDGCVYCGTQRSEIHQYNFTTGGRIAIFQCGNGAVSMKLYKDKYIFVGCYDGFVYVLDKTTGCQIGRFPGSGKMILALEIAGDKLITSAKDNTMQIIDIPKYIATIKDKS